MTSRVWIVFVISVLATSLVGGQELPRGMRGGVGTPLLPPPPLITASFPMPEQRINNISELKLKQDLFTFVRVRYDRPQPAGAWSMDHPEADLNFLAHFRGVTGINTEPVPKVVRLTDAELATYPLLYVVEGGYLNFTPEEARALRAYLQSGGFLLVDDSWGEASWQNVVAQFKLVFPNQEPKELELSHPIFHTFYDFKALPKVVTFLDRSGDAEQVKYAGFANEAGRLMVLICHNNDLGDGWERDGYDEAYSREYSQKQAFPMGINIVIYALTAKDEK